MVGLLEFVGLVVVGTGAAGLGATAVGGADLGASIGVGNGLGACGAGVLSGRGCGAVAGGFLTLSINCCKPAAIPVPAISIISIKEMRLIG